MVVGISGTAMPTSPIAVSNSPAASHRPLANPRPGGGGGLAGGLRRARAEQRRRRAGHAHLALPLAGDEPSGRRDDQQRERQHDGERRDADAVGAEAPPRGAPHAVRALVVRRAAVRFEDSAHGKTPHRLQNGHPMNRTASSGRRGSGFAGPLAAPP